MEAFLECLLFVFWILNGNISIDDTASTVGILNKKFANSEFGVGY